MSDTAAVNKQYFEYVAFRLTVLLSHPAVTAASTLVDRACPESHT